MAKLFFNLLFICKATIFFAILFLIVDIIVLWILMKPQSPTFNINSVTVTALHTTAEAELTTTFDVVFSVINPNTKLSVSYESLEITMWFDHCRIASASVAPFWQGGAETDTVIQAQVRTVGKVFPRSIINGIGEQRTRGSIDFGLTLVARVRFLCGIFRTRIRPLKIECYPLQIVFTPINSINNNDTGRLLAPSECYQV